MTPPGPSGVAAARGFFIGIEACPGGQPVWTGERRNLLVCGPTQAGKTACILSAAVIDAPGPVITTSTKPDLLRLPARRRGEHKHVEFIESSYGGWELPVTRFSPMSGVQGFTDAYLLAATLTDSWASVGQSGVSNDQYWLARGQRILAALIYAAAQDRRSITWVVDHVARRDARAALQILANDDDHTVRAILEGLTGDASGRVSNSTAAAWTFAEQAIALYALREARDRADMADFDVERFIRSHDVLHIVCPGEHSSTLGPVIAVFIEQVVRARYRAAAGLDGTAIPPLTLVLDEVANTAPLPRLTSITSEGAGQGVRVCLGTQDRAQLEDRFGEAGARTIVTNCRDHVVMGESADRPWLEDIEALVGMRAERHVAISSSQSEHGVIRSESVTEELRPWWPASHIAQLPQYTALFLRGWVPVPVDLVMLDDRP